MKSGYLLVALAFGVASSSASAATNILPGSGATVVGSSIHDGFDASVAAGNLINGTTTDAYGNGDSRWVFADNSSAEQTLTVNLGSVMSLTSAGAFFSPIDRAPVSFEVLLSSDGTNYTPIAGGSLSSGSGFVSESFNPMSAQYVQFDFGVYSQAPTLPGTGGGSFQGAGISQLSVGSVPEPSTWAMMLLGFAGIGFAGYRARKTAAAA